MKRIFALILIVGATLSVMGMDGRLEKMNAIKKNADYIHGEATTDALESAASLAYELLQNEVYAWARQNAIQLNIRSVQDINELSDTLVVQPYRGVYRVLAYLEKSKLMTLQDTTVMERDTLSVEKDSTSYRKDTTSVGKKSPSLMNDSVKRMLDRRFFGKEGKKRQRTNDALLRIGKAKNFFELKTIMQPLKEEGKILDYGKYATATKPELCYLIVYDPAGNIRALLGKGEKVRKNLRTGKDDSIGNYRGCGAIWFTLSEN